jgi:hypothetical protein
MYYFINAEISEDMPNYDFIVEAETAEEAREKASKILDKDYPDRSFKAFEEYPLKYFENDVLELMLLK